LGQLNALIVKEEYIPLHNEWKAGQRCHDAYEVYLIQEMKVHGIKNLRVVEASVMPQIISGNLNAQLK